MNDSSESFRCTKFSTSELNEIPIKHFDLESSIDSYSTLFNKNKQNFTASSEISFVNHENDQLDENPQSTGVHDRTFTKKVSKTIINAFTGKPISPNPWRKLSTKSIQQETQPYPIVPIQVRSSRSEKANSSDQFHNKITTRQSPKTLIDNEQFVDDECEIPIEDRKSIDIKPQLNTPIQRRRKKRNSLKESIDQSSTSSDEYSKEKSIDEPPKLNRSIVTDPSWYRLTDVYTSEESDENNHLFQLNTSHTIRCKSENFTFDQSTNSTPPLTPKKQQLNFLESLSERISFDEKHPDAQLYCLESAFISKEKRQQLADKLLSIFDENVFSSQLSDRVSVVWSGRLSATAGHCTSRKNTRTAVITLSHKVCDTPERCRDTLLHELCHAAVTLIDGIMEQGHGPLWKQWTRKAEQVYPFLPPISIRHTYDVIYKFTYRCVQCQYEVYRHSKSLNVAVDFCGQCMGQFELILNNNEKNSTKQEKQTPKKPLNKYNLFVKENYQIIKQSYPHLSSPQIMKQLSEEYKKKNHIDLPDLDKLKL